jgi:hypothetical protein
VRPSVRQKRRPLQDLGADDPVQRPVAVGDVADDRRRRQGRDRGALSGEPTVLGRSRATRVKESRESEGAGKGENAPRSGIGSV